MSDNTKLSKDGLNQVWLKAMTILKSLTGNVKTEKGTLQEQIDLLEENASSGVDLTQAEYDALPDTKESDGVDYYIMDEDFVATDAKAVGYDKSTSGLTRETAQGAIDEIVDKINESNTNFNNALDELNSNLTNNLLLSTTEHRVGTWIDGKPLYSITQDNNNTSKGTTSTFAHNIKNVDNIFIDLQHSYFKFANNINSVPISLSVTDNAISQAYFNIFLSVDRTNYKYFAGSASSSTGHVITFLYTKTMD